MKVQFSKPLSQYHYIAMFDLASKKTGFCLWDIVNKRPIYTKQLVVKTTDELPAFSLYTAIHECIQTVCELYQINKDDLLIYKEAMPTQVHGGASTVQTFIALARSHAILDLYTLQNNFNIYDYVGVYPISTHAYLKKLLGLDHNYKVDKTDIQKYIEKEYNLLGLTADEYDAIFLAKTFIEVKWNKDIEEEIRNIKRHKKELKAQKSIDQCDQEITRLEYLKV